MKTGDIQYKMSEREREGGEKMEQRIIPCSLLGATGGKMRESLRKFMCFKSILCVRLFAARKIVSLVCLVYCLRLNAPTQTISFIMRTTAAAAARECECLSSFMFRFKFYSRFTWCIVCERVCGAIQNELFMLCAHVNWIHQLIAFSDVFALAAGWVADGNDTHTHTTMARLMCIVH